MFYIQNFSYTSNLNSIKCLDGVLLMTISTCQGTEGWKGLFPDPPSVKTFFCSDEDESQNSESESRTNLQWNMNFKKLIFSSTVSLSSFSTYRFLDYFRFLFVLFISILFFVTYMYYTLCTIYYIPVQCLF